MLTEKDTSRRYGCGPGISTAIVEGGEETRRAKNGGFKETAPSKNGRVKRSCERRELCAALGLGLCNHVTSPYSPHSNPTQTKCAGTQTVLTSLSNGGSFVSTNVSETENGRPSVITCMTPVRTPKPTLLPLPLKIATPVLESLSDSSVEAHFRRSLGSAYKEEYFRQQEQEPSRSVTVAATSPMSPSVSVSGSVDDHFAKALGDKWNKLQSTDPTGSEGHSLLKRTSMVSI